MKTRLSILLITLALTTTLQIRLSHDYKKGYSYQISGPEIEEVIDADKKMKQYLKSQAPKKIPGPATPVATPKPIPSRK